MLGGDESLGDELARVFPGAPRRRPVRRVRQEDA